MKPISDHTISALVWIMRTMLKGSRTDSVFGST